MTSSNSLTYLRDEHVVRMGSNNCSNVYVYACTNLGPSSSPSIVALHFPTNHVKSFVRFNSNRKRPTILFSILPATLLRLLQLKAHTRSFISLHINNSIKKHVAQFFYARKRNSHIFIRLHCIMSHKHFHALYFYFGINIFDLTHEPIWKPRNFRARFSTSGRISLRSRSSRETCIDLLSKNTHGKIFGIQHGKFNISWISDWSSATKMQHYVSFQFREFYHSSEKSL